jgi:protein-disulfide isomerase
MTDIDANKPLPELALGRGATELEVFIEPTCPYCARAFGKLPDLLKAVGEDRLTVRLRLLSQPWHLFSSVTTRAVLAASATAGGRDAALKALAGIYADRDAFEAEEHCKGAVMDRSPNQIVAAVSAIVGTDLMPAYQSKAVDKAVRWHTRYIRQNGVHVSPSFAVNGLLEPNMGSRQTVEEWTALLEPHLAG